ncbi:Wzz/FepE/Etk N-terminal domain-containing protein [Ferrimonas balearica]|uniref:Wzz/FepE/Etk N-terminal domain-containing protein n=1 Tax=Ferrimonas balearica TaxID=44012 RepID=UPI001C992953|nr:Wzz/FepE/Etk N-terminal domain-containing protein [Ferrimonas balearica]MBY5990766.1 LPS O-antigen length regulator [Ferrimonas balearica]
MSELPTNYQRDASFDSRLADDEIDLRELFSAIWAGKWVISAVTGVFAIVAVAIALYLPNIYKSEVLLAPASSEQSSGLAGLAGQFGGLASLAGINLGGSGIDKTTLAIEVMKSREFIAQFIDKHDLLVPLMAVKSWDSEANKLVLDSDKYNSDSNQWTREPVPPRQAKPSPLEAFEEFRQILNVSQDKQTSLVKVSIEHYSPIVAQQWVEWLTIAINDEMKTRDLREAQRSIAYLERQLAQTRVAEMQTVLYQLIEEQTKTIMFAEVRDEYVFKTVDPAVIPELRARPARALICVLGTVLGALFGTIIVLIRYFYKKESSAR